MYFLVSFANSLRPYLSEYTGEKLIKYSITKQV